MSLPILTDRLFDYAGMFPPAALSFEDALATSARFPETLEHPGIKAADMVVTPEYLPRLDEAAFATADFDRACKTCIVGVSVEQAPEMAIASHELPAQVEPVSIEAHAGHLDVDDALIATQDAGGLPVYFEPKWTPTEWATDGPKLWDLLDRLDVGLKVRCAGPTSLDPATLASIFVAASRRELRIKFTQGLHHPFANDPRYDNEHGFLQVLAGLRLAQNLSLDAPAVEAVLRSDAAELDFSNGIRWRDHAIDTRELQAAINRVPVQIGSCSLHEPDADLGMLQAV